MKACCCQLAGTKACENCGSNNYQLGSITYHPNLPMVDWMHNTLCIENKPLDIKQLQLSQISADELLGELNRRTNIFVKESFVDNNQKIYVVVVKN
jgi:hypothetical protein